MLPSAPMLPSNPTLPIFPFFPMLPSTPTRPIFPFFPMLPSSPMLPVFHFFPKLPSSPMLPIFHFFQKLPSTPDACYCWRADGHNPLAATSLTWCPEVGLAKPHGCILYLDAHIVTRLVPANSLHQIHCKLLCVFRVWGLGFRV